MAKLTLQERIVAKMLEMGYQELISPSKKYRKFTSDKPDRFYWVGKMGAVRKGKTSTNSLSVSDHWYKMINPGHI